MRYQLRFDDVRKSPRHVDVHVLTMVLYKSDGIYVQYVGGYVAGSDLMRKTEKDTPRFWSAVAVGIAGTVEDGMRRDEIDLGTDDATRHQLLSFDVDVFAATRLANSDEVLPELSDEAVVAEFEVP
jgi:hypothetical protein